MPEMIDKLSRMKGASTSKSYLIGLERGRIWADEIADYIEIREWSELTVKSINEAILPNGEEDQFHVLRAETDLEWQTYVQGWLDGVKEIYEKY